MQNENSTKADVYEAALRIILRRPHSEGELSDKLRRKNFDAEEIAATLGQLRAEKQLDDARLAKEFVRYCLDYKPMGRRGIAQKLMLRRFRQQEIAAALADLTREQEKQAARQLLERRLDRPSVAGLAAQEQHERMARFLLARGFDQGLVLEVLREARSAMRSTNPAP